MNDLTFTELIIHFRAWKNIAKNNYINLQLDQLSNILSILESTQNEIEDKTAAIIMARNSCQKCKGKPDAELCPMCKALVRVI